MPISARPRSKILFVPIGLDWIPLTLTVMMATIGLAMKLRDQRYADVRVGVRYQCSHYPHSSRLQNSTDKSSSSICYVIFATDASAFVRSIKDVYCDRKAGRPSVVCYDPVLC